MHDSMGDDAVHITLNNRIVLGYHTYIDGIYYIFYTHFVSYVRRHTKKK